MEWDDTLSDTVLVPCGHFPYTESVKYPHIPIKPLLFWTNKIWRELPHFFAKPHVSRRIKWNVSSWRYCTIACALKQTRKPDTSVYWPHNNWSASVRIKRGGGGVGGEMWQERRAEWQAESYRARNVTPVLTDWIRNRSSLPRVIDMQ